MTDFLGGKDLSCTDAGSDAEETVPLPMQVEEDVPEAVAEPEAAPEAAAAAAAALGAVHEATLNADGDAEADALPEAVSKAAPEAAPEAEELLEASTHIPEPLPLPLLLSSSLPLPLPLPLPESAAAPEFMDVAVEDAKAAVAAAEGSEAVNPIISKPKAAKIKLPGYDKPAKFCPGQIGADFDVCYLCRNPSYTSSGCNNPEHCTASFCQPCLAESLETNKLCPSNCGNESAKVVINAKETKHNRGKLVTCINAYDSDSDGEENDNGGAQLMISEDHHETLTKRKHDDMSKTHCDWVGQVGKLLEHLEKDCLLVPVDCLNSGCKCRVLRCNVGHHTENCLLRLIECVHCSERVPHISMSAHVASDCSKAPVPCIACGENMPRCEVDNHRQNLCPEAIVTCPYSSMDCLAILLRKQVGEHMVKASEDHNKLMMSKILSLEQSVIKQQNKIIKLESANKKLNSKVNEEPRLTKTFVWTLSSMAARLKQLRSLSSIRSAEFEVPDLFAVSAGQKVYMDASFTSCEGTNNLTVYSLDVTLFKTSVKVPKGSASKTINPPVSVSGWSVNIVGGSSHEYGVDEEASELGHRCNLTQDLEPLIDDDQVVIEIVIPIHPIDTDITDYR